MDNAKQLVVLTAAVTSAGLFVQTMPDLATLQQLPSGETHGRIPATWVAAGLAASVGALAALLLGDMLPLLVSGVVAVALAVTYEITARHGD